MSAGAEAEPEPFARASLEHVCERRRHVQVRVALSPLSFRGAVPAKVEGKGGEAGLA